MGARAPPVNQPSPGDPIWKRLLFRAFLHPTDTTTTLLWAALCGVGGGLMGVLYHWLFRRLTDLWGLLFAGHAPAGDTILSAADALEWPARLLLPASGALLAMSLLVRFRRKAAEGPSDILEAVAITDGRIPARPGLLKALASLLSLTSGGSIGREGPIIHLGAALSSKIGQSLGFAPARLRILAGCGAAAGFAGAFHVTIGAALFVMEVIFGNFAPELFGPLVLASVMGTLVARFAFGSEPIFAVARFDFFPSEIPLYLFLGIFAGALSPLFMRGLWRVERALKRAVPALWVRLPLAGLLVGALGILWPELWGNGYDTIHEVILRAPPWKLVLTLFLLKPLATAIMVGGGTPGGVFTPTLFLGACAGTLLGKVFAAYWPGPTGGPVAYALVGMGAVLAGTTHAPLTAIFVLFEMTLDYDIVLPLMLSASVASILSRRLHADSIYTEPLSRQGIRASKTPDADFFRSRSVSEIMRPLGPHDAATSTARFSEVVERFMNISGRYLYVTDTAGGYLGAISLNEIKSVLHEGSGLDFVIAQDMTDATFPRTRPQATLSEALDTFLTRDCERLPVVDAADGQLVGTISKSDILSLYNREVLTGRSVVTNVIAQAEPSDQGVLAAYRIETVPVPLDWAGKTLKEINLKEAGVAVLAIEERQGLSRLQRLPNPFDRLGDEDSLVVLGTPEQIKRLQRQS